MLIVADGDRNCQKVRWFSKNICGYAKDVMKIINKIITWIKFNLFDKCPTCGMKLYHWDWDKWKCAKCKRTWYG